jgi:hypothetical protein
VYPVVESEFSPVLFSFLSNVCPLPADTVRDAIDAAVLIFAQIDPAACGGGGGVVVM